MPIWSEILEELHKNPLPDGRPDHDRIRRKYLHSLNLHTNRNVILYSSGWLQKDAPPNLTSITDEDTQAFMETTKELVETWLSNYMFSDTSDHLERAKSIADWLSGHKNFKSHSRHLARDTLKEHGLKIVKLEDNQQLQDLSLSVFHATTHTFSATPAVKIVENHMGRAFIKIHNVV